MRATLFEQMIRAMQADRVDRVILTGMGDATIEIEAERFVPATTQTIRIKHRMDAGNEQSFADWVSTAGGKIDDLILHVEPKPITRTES